MKIRIYCRAHRRWHSRHAAQHCWYVSPAKSNAPRPGECLNKHGVSRGALCPLVKDDPED